MSTEQTIFSSKKGISFEVLWKKYWKVHFQRELGKIRIKNFQYILGFNLAIADIILIGGAINSQHLSLCVMNFCVRIRWSSQEYKAVPMPKPRKKVTLTTAKKRKK